MKPFSFFPLPRSGGSARVRVRTFMLAAALCLPALAQPGHFVSQTKSTFITRGDFDGDGRLDVALIERETGVSRLGIMQAGNELMFSAAFSTGVEPVDAVASGPLLMEGQDAIAVASRNENAVHLISGEPGARPPIIASNGVPGPAALAATRFDDSRQDALSDLFLGFDFDPSGYAAGALENTEGLTYNPLSRLAVDAPLRDANPLPLSSASEIHAVGAVERGLSRSRYHLFQPGPSVLKSITQIDGLAPDARYVTGHFEGSATMLVFFRPGARELDFYTYQEDTKTFSHKVSWETEASIFFVAALPSPGEPDRLLVLFEGSRTAKIFTYADKQLTLYQEMDLAIEGEISQAAVSLGDGIFATFSAAHQGGPPTSFQVHKDVGSRYETLQSGSLPPPSGPSRTANLLYFQGEPFVQDEASLTAAFRFPDWTADVGGVPGKLDVTTENFQGSVLGLGQPSALTHTELPAGASHALGNQVRGDASIFLLDSAWRDGPSAPHLSPHPGTYPTAVSVTIEPAHEDHTVFFRTSPDNLFAPYTQPFFLFTETTVDAYSVDPNGDISPLASATYRFTLPPQDQDSDQDGVPDFVEAGSGLDIDGGPDSDNDGFSDLDELASDPPSDPLDPDSSPARRLETSGRLLLSVTPEIHRDSSEEPLSAGETVLIQVHDIGGILLGEGLTDSSGAAVFEVQPVTPRKKLLVVSTGLIFEANPPQEGGPVGRQLAGLVAVLGTDHAALSFVYDPSSPSTQADAWLQAARAAFADRGPWEISFTLDLDAAIHFALVEQVLAMALETRGLGSSIERPDFLAGHPRNLFPFFSKILTPDQLASIERPSETQPPYFSTAFRIQTVVEEVEGLLGNAEEDSPLGELRQLAQDLYAVSRQDHFPEEGSLPPPLDALRLFVTFLHQLPNLYHERLGRTFDQLATLGTELDSLLLQLTRRPLTTLEVRLSPSQPTADCTHVISTDDGTTYCLVNAQGDPYAFLDTFSLSPATTLSITGFTDHPDRDDTPVIQVLHARAAILALSSAADSDGNLLSDEWELLFFGNTGRDPMEPADGGRYSLLEEFLAGTDPTDPNDHPDSEPVVFTLDDTDASESDSDGIRSIEFEWPEAYFHHFEVVLLSSNSMGDFDSQLATVEHIEGNRYRVLVPVTTEARGFYQVALRLR